MSATYLEKHKNKRLRLRDGSMERQMWECKQNIIGRIWIIFLCAGKFS